MKLCVLPSFQQMGLFCNVGVVSQDGYITWAHSVVLVAVMPSLGKVLHGRSQRVQYIHTDLPHDIVSKQVKALYRRIVRTELSLNENYGCQIQNCIYQYFSKKWHCDCLLHTDSGDALAVHMCILAAKWPYLIPSSVLHSQGIFRLISDYNSGDVEAVIGSLYCIFSTAESSVLSSSQNINSLTGEIPLLPMSQLEDCQMKHPHHCEEDIFSPQPVHLIKHNVASSEEGGSSSVQGSYEQSMPQERRQLTSEGASGLGYFDNESTDKPCVCTRCGKGFSQKSDLKRHAVSHTGSRLYSCEWCKKEFISQSEVRRHMRTHTGEKPYSCEKCFKTFRQRGHVNEHMRTHRPKSDKVYQCPQCSKIFACQGYLSKHTKTHTTDMPFSCDICHKSFKHRQSLLLHTRKHLGLRPYECPHCDKSFTVKECLDSHLRTHSGEKPFQCHRCDRSFRHQSGLYIHLKQHDGLKPYTCEQCKKSFARLEHLNRHLRNHTGEKPFKCVHCGKAYSWQTSLKIHLATHTEVSSGIEYLCDTCGKSFKSPFNLAMHVKTHAGLKPYTCDICKKTYTKSGSLHRHKMSHTGEKPFMCNKCGKCFAQQIHLKNHVQTHSTEKSYTCGKCDKTFKYQSSLYRHLKVHTELPLDNYDH